MNAWGTDRSRPGRRAVEGAEYDAWARYYDYTNKGLVGEAEFYVGHAMRTGGRVLELGCGTGRIAIPMAMSGLDVTGLDNSRAMLGVCRAKWRAVGRLAGKLRLVEADMREFNVKGPFDLVIMAYRTFMHLLTPDDQRRCLAAARRHLKPGGALVLNCWVPKPTKIAPLAGDHVGLQYAGRHEMDDGRFLVHFCSTSCDEFNQLLCEEHVLHESDAAGKVKRSEVLHMERAWITPREMEHLARSCGYEIEAVLGDFDGGPLTAASTEMLWLLRRPSSPDAGA